MFEVGDTVPLTFRVINEQQALVDAADVILTVVRPDGTPVGCAVGHDSLGSYSSVFEPVEAGRHVVRWTATAPNKVATDVLNVSPTTSAALASLAELKQHMNITEDVDDDELRQHLAAATAIVERHLGQVVARRTITEVHTVAAAGVRRGRLFLSQGPVTALVSAASVDGLTTWNVGDLLLDAVTGEIRPGAASLHGDVAVTYEAGQAVTPPHVVLAALIIAAHLFQLQRAPTLGAAPSFGGGDTAVPLGQGYAIPNRAAELLGGRPPVIA